jgi:hypothetical protein
MAKDDGFDETWYVNAYPFVACFPISPGEHFRRFGKRLGLKPQDPKKRGLEYQTASSLNEQPSQVSSATLRKQIRNRTESFDALPLKMSTEPLDLSEGDKSKGKDRYISADGTTNGATLTGSRRRYESLAVEQAQASDLDGISIEFDHGFARWSGTRPNASVTLKLREMNDTSVFNEGRYLFVFHSELISGSLKAPRLYIDYGEGFSNDAGCVFELRQALGHEPFFASIDISRPVISMRLVPSEVDFECYCLWLGFEAYQVVEAIAPLRAPSQTHLMLLENSRYHLPTQSDYAEDYYTRLALNSGMRPAYFAPPSERSVQVPKAAPKAIAFYEPRPSWVKVAAAMPQYKGHYQPKLPLDLGFYDVNLTDVYARQVQIAKHYGLYGFCFRYSLRVDPFSGLEVLTRALSLKTEEFDFPFCFCVGDWDFVEEGIEPCKSSNREENWQSVFEALKPYFEDPCYIRIDNKPVVIIQRSAHTEALMAAKNAWRSFALEAGLDGIYLILSDTGQSDYWQEIGCDGLCFFPKAHFEADRCEPSPLLLNQDFDGSILDYNRVADHGCTSLLAMSDQEKRDRIFPAVSVGWDNEANRTGTSLSFHNVTPNAYHAWLSAALKFSDECHHASSRFVFINAWNDWANGAYVEPDQKAGYGYLHALSAGLKGFETANIAAEQLVQSYNNRNGVRKSDTAMCVHIFYEDLIDEMSAAIFASATTQAQDRILSIPNDWSSEAVQQAIAKFQPVWIFRTENVGRDIWPFLSHVKICLDLGYTLACKIHSKKSLHLEWGHQWRRDFLNALLHPDIVNIIHSKFSENLSLGLAAPASSRATCADANTVVNNAENMTYLLARLKIASDFYGEFVAGSMFWFRPLAFKQLAYCGLTGHDFGVELGAIDGTIAHAFERILPLIVTQSGYSIEWFDSDFYLNPYSA